MSWLYSFLIHLMRAAYLAYLSSFVWPDMQNFTKRTSYEALSRLFVTRTLEFILPKTDFNTYGSVIYETMSDYIEIHRSYMYMGLTEFTYVCREMY
jgi:hypothetical protein